MKRVILFLFIFNLGLCCALCYLRNLHKDYKVIEINGEEALKQNNISIENEENYLNIKGLFLAPLVCFQKGVKFKNKINNIKFKIFKGNKSRIQEIFFEESYKIKDQIMVEMKLIDKTFEDLNKEIINYFKKNKKI